ncbi:MAG: ROK family transcriptional regulator [Anaerolineae bacterium]|nr:ROK family transcriptional regulator [Anaerolineae bacterium]
MRAIYEGVADNRAALAQETQLAKPTVSELIGELIEEGLLIEEGRGHSTREGGKRPRLLKFVPGARHVIGLSVNDDYVMGALAYLDGRIVARHYTDLDGAQGEVVVAVVCETINGLLAQLDAPLLCIGIGVSGAVDAKAGIVTYAPLLGWQQVPLAERIEAIYQTPVYLANSTALVAMAQFVYGPTDPVNCFAAVRMGSSVGVGLVVNGAIYDGGGEIGALRMASGSPVDVRPEDTGRLDTFLGWPYVRQRARELCEAYPYPNRQFNAGDPLSYLHIRYAIQNGDPAALALQDELSQHLAQVFAWIIGLLTPDHISLAGPIADLGETMLEQTVAYTRDLVWPDLIQTVTFSLTEASSLVAVGAIAQALHRELGLV